MDHLREHGYVIVPNVLNATECQRMQDGFWEFWQARGVTRDPSTWKNLYNYFPNHGMLIQHYGFGHCQAIWDVREKVKPIFADLWGTDRLTTSFDGGSMGVPPEVTGRGWHHKDWLHLDQSPTRNGLEAYQSWVTPLDVREGDGTLTVLKGSHKKHAEFADRFSLRVLPDDSTKVKHQKKQDWFKLTQEHVDWYDCEQVDITCPAGSMVVWDSRTVHAGKAPRKGRAAPNLRMVAYVCMQPDRLTDSLRKKKQIALLEGRMTSHWANRVKLFGKKPRTYGKPLPPELTYVPPCLTETTAALAGFQGDCPLTIQDATARAAAANTLLQQLKKRKRHK